MLLHIIKIKLSKVTRLTLVLWNSSEIFFFYLWEAPSVIGHAIRRFPYSDVKEKNIYLDKNDFFFPVSVTNPPVKEL